MDSIVLLLGVPAVGKTTLGRELEKRGLRYEPAGETKRKILANLQIRKDLSSLNQVESTLINALYFERLNTANNLCDFLVTPLGLRYAHLIVDTHATYPLGDGSYVELLPDTGISAVAVIILKAPADVLVQRRLDRGRKHDATLFDWVRVEQQVEIASARRYAETHDARILELDGTKPVDELAEKVMLFVRQTKEL